MFEYLIISYNVLSLAMETFIVYNVYFWPYSFRVMLYNKSAKHNLAAGKCVWHLNMLVCYRKYTCQSIEQLSGISLNYSNNEIISILSSNLTIKAINTYYGLTPKCSAKYFTVKSLLVLPNLRCIGGHIVRGRSNVNVHVGFASRLSGSSSETKRKERPLLLLQGKGVNINRCFIRGH